MTILISPYSQKLRNGKENPKNYPYWKELVIALRERGHYLIQIGTLSEALLDVQEARLNCSLEELKKLLEECDIWISVDNFLPHLAKEIKKGIVLWGKSDPRLFGYADNINLVKDSRLFRSKQFDIWEREEFSSDVFVEPEEVLKALV